MNSPSDGHTGDKAGTPIPEEYRPILHKAAATCAAFTKVIDSYKMLIQTERDDIKTMGATLATHLLTLDTIDQQLAAMGTLILSLQNDLEKVLPEDPKPEKQDETE